MGHPHPPSLSRAAPVLLMVSLYQKCSVLLPLAWEPWFCNGCFQLLPTHTIQFGRVFKHPTFLVLPGIRWRATWTLTFAACIVPFCLVRWKITNLPFLYLSFYQWWRHCSSHRIHFCNRKRTTGEVESLYSSLPEFHRLTRLWGQVIQSAPWGGEASLGYKRRLDNPGLSEWSESPSTC